jgi:hypothetical protein
MKQHLKGSKFEDVEENKTLPPLLNIVDYWVVQFHGVLNQFRNVDETFGFIPNRTE